MTPIAHLTCQEIRALIEERNQADPMRQSVTLHLMAPSLLDMLIELRSREMMVDTFCAEMAGAKEEENPFRTKLEKLICAAANL